MATDIPTISTAIESLIAGIGSLPTPALGRSAFVKRGQAKKWDEASLADVDREFAVGDWTAGQPIGFGQASDAMIDSEVTIMVGHVIPNDISQGIERRDQDVFRIVREMEDPVNRPSDVATLRWLGQNITETETHWVTEITFQAVYIGSK